MSKIANREERFGRLIQEGIDDIEAGRFVEVERDELDGWLGSFAQPQSQ